MSKPAGCVFCGSTTNKMSREHWLPQSWGPLIPHEATGAWIQYGTDDGGSPYLRERDIPRGPFDRPVGGVCKPCNQSWMNELDWSIRDLVALGMAHGQVDLIPAEKVLPLATWAVKTALVRSLADGWQPEGPAAPELFRAVHADRRPPPHAVVQLGRCTQYVRPGGSNSFGTMEWRHPVAHAEHGRVNIVTWGLGEAYFQVALPTSTRVARRTARAAMGVLPDQAGAERVLQLWPAPAGDRLMPADPIPPRIASACGNPLAILQGNPLHPSDFDAE